MTMNLLHTLPEQPLAIIGDIHGERKALDALLERLNQNAETRDRLLIFIGDLCDRGPDSVGVIARVQSLIDQGKAYAILGNHEINLLANDAKDGSGWFFDSREASDKTFYSPFTRASATQRPQIRDFFANLPLALQMPGLRIVHAAWDPVAIQEISTVPCGEILALIHACEQRVRQAAEHDNLHARYLAEMQRWATQIEDRQNPPPYLDAVADYETLEQRINPIKRLTSGIEARCPHPFFSGNRWRYSDRIPWWNDDADPTPVVIGHYWRLYEPPSSPDAWRYSLLFQGVPPTAWHGSTRQAFCVDYSVGARWSARKKGLADQGRKRFRLAAMLWPERTLVFDDGQRCATDDGQHGAAH